MKSLIAKIRTVKQAASSRPCSVIDDIYVIVMEAIGEAKESIANSQSFNLALVEQAMEALPLNTEEFGVFSNRVRNAQSYVEKDEFGAASYELGLLQRKLASLWTKQMWMRTAS